MAEYLIQGETLANMADKIRVLNGVEGTMTPAQMDGNLGEVNVEVVDQAELIAQIASALEGKAAGGGGANIETCTINLLDSFGYGIYYSCISSDDNAIISGYTDAATIELHAYKNHILTMCVPGASSIDAIGLDCSGVEYIENKWNGNLMLVFKLTDEIVNIRFFDPFPAPEN